MPFSNFFLLSLPMHIFGSMLGLCCTFYLSVSFSSRCILCRKGTFAKQRWTWCENEIAAHVVLRHLLQVITLTRLFLTRSSSRYRFSPLFTTRRWAITRPISPNNWSEWIIWTNRSPASMSSETTAVSSPVNMTSPPHRSVYVRKGTPADVLMMIQVSSLRSPLSGVITLMLLWS